MTLDRLDARLEQHAYGLVRERAVADVPADQRDERELVLGAQPAAELGECLLERRAGSCEQAQVLARVAQRPDLDALAREGREELRQRRGAIGLRAKREQHAHDALARRDAARPVVARLGVEPRAGRERLVHVEQAHGDVRAPRRSERRGVEHLGAVEGELGSLGEAQALDHARVGHELGIGRHQTAHGLPQLQLGGAHGLGHERGREIGAVPAERRQVALAILGQEARHDRDAGHLLQRRAHVAQRIGERQRVAEARVARQAEVEGVDWRRQHAARTQRVGDDARAHALAEGEHEVALLERQPAALPDPVEQPEELAEVAVEQLAVEAQLAQDRAVPDAHAVALGEALGRRARDGVEQLGDALVGADDQQRARPAVFAHECADSLHAGAVRQRGSAELHHALEGHSAQHTCPAGRTTGPDAAC